MWFMNKIANPILRWILRSPLHGLMSASLLLITYRGRRSGQEFTLPVQYAQEGNQFYIMPGQPEKKTWWRNFKTETPVKIILKGKALNGQARLLAAESELQVIADGLEAYIRRFPALAKVHNVRPESNGEFNRADLLQVASTILLIQVTTNESSSR
jgi:deazaflavin-dependent oxidoreductase (nitroreductase family)